MFVDFKVSCDHNKNKALKKCPLKSGLKKLVGWIVKAAEIAKE